MAKSQLDTDFERAPVEFLTYRALRPQANWNLVGAGAIGNPFDKNPQGSMQNPAPIDAVLTARSDARIGYTKLTAVAGEKNIYDAAIRSRVQVGNDIANYVPVWYLPWASNHLTKITIPPKVADRGNVAAASTPDIFLTAALCGCSVMVHGNPAGPTITHGGTSDDRSNSSNPNAFAGTSKQHWKGIFQADLNSRGKNGAISGIHVEDYSAHNGGSTPEATAVSTFLANNSLQRMRVDSVSPSGCVFGIRDNQNQWSFYLQKIVTIRFTHMRKGGIVDRIRQKGYVEVKVKRTYTNDGSESAMVLSQDTVAVPVQVTKFFPGNGAASVATIDPATVKVILNAYA
jgi:hypothetical protein